ncbi:MAG: YfhO family protein [Candidatus Hinthialibacter antarcticus]|nr:YfhO family protein [Candidatus Hinthialibacter antarcticus]
MANPPICEVPRWQRFDAVSVLLLIAIAMLCNSSIAFLGQLPLDSDSLLFFYPQVAMQGDADVGLWNPYQFCGFPRDANPQAQLLYWPAWIAMLLPAQTAFPILIIAHYALGGIGMYLLLRGLRLSPLAALFGASAFLLNTYWRCKITNLGILEGAAWAPAFLYFNLLALQRGSYIPLMVASLFLSMTILAGVPHTAAYLLLLSFILHIGFTSFNTRSLGRSLSMYAAMVLTALLLSCGMLIPALFNLPATVRTELGLHEALAGSIPLADLWKCFIGGLSQPGISRLDPWEGTCYIGATALLLLPIGWKTMPRQLRWPLTFAVIFAALLTAGRQGVLYPLMYQWLLGWNALNLPNRSLLMAAMALPIFAGFGAEALLNMSPSPRRSVVLLTGGLIASAIWLCAAWSNPTLFSTLVHSGLTQPFQPGAYSDGAWALFTCCLWIGLTLLVIACMARNWIKPNVCLSILVLLIAAQSAQYTQRLFLETTPSTYMQAPRTARAIHDWQSAQPFARMCGFDPTLDSGMDIRMRYVRPVISPRLNEVFQVYDAQGYDPLIPKQYAELTRAWAGHSEIVHPDRNIRFKTLPPRMLDMLGVGAIVGRPNTLTLYQGQVAIDEPSRVETSLQQPQRIESLLLRWVTVGAGRLQQGAQIGRVHLLSASQTVQTFPVRIGVDVADQFVQYGPDTAAHRPATEYRWFPIPSRFGYLKARQYEAIYPVQTNQAIDAVSIELTTSNISLLVYGVFADASQNTLPRITDAAEVSVWKNETCPGMAYLSRSPIEYERIETMIEQMNEWPHDQPLPVFFDKNDGPAPERAANSQRLQGNATIEYNRNHSDSFTLDIQADFDAILAVAEGYSPHWTATQDGKPLTVYRANHALMAVQVSAGTHEIEFQYFPKLYYYGCSLSTTALLLIFSLLFLYPRLWLLRERETERNGSQS